MTTIVINRDKGIISSDSRCTYTESSRHFEIKNYLPRFNYKSKTTHEDNTTKIFKVGSVVVCGCGSLLLLQETVNNLFNWGSKIPKRFYVKDSYNLSGTNVYLTKRTMGKVYTILLELKATKILWTNYQVVTITKDIANTNYTMNGSGWRFAAGAVQSGKDDKEAIEIAMKFDNNTGGEVKQVFV